MTRRFVRVLGTLADRESSIATTSGTTLIIWPRSISAGSEASPERHETLEDWARRGDASPLFPRSGGRHRGPDPTRRCRFRCQAFWGQPGVSHVLGRRATDLQRDHESG